MVRLILNYTFPFKSVKVTSKKRYVLLICVINVSRRKMIKAMLYILEMCNLS